MAEQLSVWQQGYVAEAAHTRMDHIVHRRAGTKTDIASPKACPTSEALLLKVTLPPQMHQQLESKCCNPEPVKNLDSTYDMIGM